MDRVSTIPEITHSQAAVLRAVSDHVVSYIGTPAIGNFDAELLIDRCDGVACLTTLGKDSLASYDADNVTVKRETFDNLASLARQALRELKNHGVALDLQVLMKEFLRSHNIHTTRTPVG